MSFKINTNQPPYKKLGLPYLISNSKEEEKVSKHLIERQKYEEENSVDSQFIKTWLSSELKKSKVQIENLYEDKVFKRPVFLINNQNTNSNQIKRSQSLKKKIKKLKPLTSKEKRESKVYELEENVKKYSLFEGLHCLWLGYIEELCKGLDPKAIREKLIKADYHGAIIKVVKSKNVQIIGQQGIIIHELKNVFKIINEMDKVILIPKNNTIFEIEINQIKYQLHGQFLLIRSFDRAAKKIKPHKTIEF